MYFDYAFLLNNFYQDHYIPEFSEHTSVVIPVKAKLWENKKKYIPLLNASNFKFCFAFLSDQMPRQQAEIKQMLEALSMYFFFPNYEKIGGTYLIASDADTREAKEALNATELLLQAHGIAPISRNLIATQPASSTQSPAYFFYNKPIAAPSNLQLENAGFDAVFCQLVTEMGGRKKVLVPVADEADFRTKQKDLVAFEAWVERHQVQYGELLLNFKSARNAQLKLEADNSKLRFRLDNYNDYLKLLREMAVLHVNEFQRIQREQQMAQLNYMPGGNTNYGPANYVSNTGDDELQKQIAYLKTNRDSIQDFYNTEYELLPLWYKRFGHIVKVLMGKRSFKSLYK